MGEAFLKSMSIYTRTVPEVRYSAKQNDVYLCACWLGIQRLICVISSVFMLLFKFYGLFITRVHTRTAHFSDVNDVNEI